MAKRLLMLSFFLAAGFNLVLAEESKKTDDEIMQVRVKEIHFFVTPTFKFVLPDTSIKMGIVQDFEKSVIEGSTEYNYVYSKMNYLLKYSLKFMFPVSASLYDNIWFERVFEKKHYVQRNRGIGAAVESPVFLGFLKAAESIRRENYYFAALDEDIAVDDGAINIWDSRVEADYKRPEKDYELLTSVHFEKGIPGSESKYNYLYLNVSAANTFYINGSDKLSVSADYGYLLERYDLPAWKRYSLGGYDTLWGYKVDEFYGDYRFKCRLRYDRILFDDIGFKVMLMELKSINGFILVDMGNTGDIWEMQKLDRYKTGAGAGVEVNLVYNKMSKFKLSFALAQAINGSSVPTFYFVYDIM